MGSASSKNIVAPKNKPSNGKRILLVDNDKILLRVLRMKFQQAGFDVEECYDGSQGLEVLKRKTFDGVVLDLMMPVVDGFDVLKALGTTQNKSTPVFVLSSMANPDAATRVKSLGAKAFFPKFQLSLKAVIDDIVKAVLH